MDSLAALRASCRDDSLGFELIDASKDSCGDLTQAHAIRIKSTGQEFDLNSSTRFESADTELGKIDLRTIVNCWLTRDLSIAEYIRVSDSRGIPNLTFLERTDLLEWLEGNSDESEYINGTAAQGANVGTGDNEELGSSVASTVEREPLLNYRTVLQGNKKVDFSGVAQLSHKQIVTEFRQVGSVSLHKPETHSSHSNGSSAASDSGILPPLKPARGKDPIILLSPSPSSLLNMANVQQFLENGSFNSVLKSSASSNLLRIVRHSKIIGSKVRFVVVDSCDQFKPEYWNRVVAVFVTGQAWQFRSYRWNDPNQLFQNVLGFSLVYKNDPIPDAMKNWNVNIEQLDRNARFKDREAVERIWERIEAYMIRRGWPIANAK